MRTFIKIAFLLSLFFHQELDAQCLSVTTNIANVSCKGGTTGIISISPNNGQTPYTYIWNTGTTTVSAGFTITGLAAGAYNITVEDNLGCDTILTPIITEPLTNLTSTAAPTSNYNGSGVSCFGNCDGSATVSSTGGVAPYDYLWSNGATTESISGLCAGVYSVTAEDANGCTNSHQVIITEPVTMVAANVTIDSNISCFGACDGAATVTAAGGVGAYTYTWANGAITQTITGLCAGNFCVTVADANGCIDTSCIYMTEPTAVTASIASSTNASCNGMTDGTATVVGSGGVGSYAFLWSPSAGNQTGLTAIGLSSASHCVTVTDANGCFDSTCVNIGAPTPIAVTTVLDTAVSCFGTCDASISVIVTGGAPPYQYANGGGTFTASNTFSNLCSGQYIIDVVDANGCIGRDTITISDPTALTVSINSLDTICQGTTGTLTAVSSNCTGGCTYNWSTGSTSPSITYTMPGLSYCVTVTNGNGCTNNACITPDSIDFGVEITNAIISNGEKYGIVYQGTPHPIQTNSSYPNQTSYNWAPASDLSCSACPNPLANPNTPTQYVLTATHNTLGCISMDTITIHPYQTDTVYLEVALDSTINYCSNIPSFVTHTGSSPINNPLTYGSITYSLTNCFDYTSSGGMQGVDTIVWVDCGTANIGVLPVQVCDTTIIYVTTASCVWPGDADNDGIANNHDLLPIGLHYNATGSTRTNATINYTCQPSRDWGTTISGMPTIDLKHTDCNGDGLINGTDTNAIILNWAQTHLKNGNSVTTGVDLYIDTATVAPGDVVSLPIVLGTTPSNGYGIAFTINYDPLGVDTNTVSMDFTTSWLGTINSDMIGISKDFYHQGQVEVALTRIDHNSVVGSGTIGHINLTIKDDVLPKSSFVRLDFDITNVRYIDHNGTVIPTSPTRSQILITDPNLGLTNTNKKEQNLMAYPNPTTGGVKIQSLSQNIEKVFIYDIRGVLVDQKHDIGQLDTEMNLKNLPNGMYLIRVISNSQINSLRIQKQ
ncbi:T9SS type A sorting domain-containing protein [Aureispira anguillae]|uniref:T9SS type A sorting domain-containing protein n=1 Tax=Aureispira anguillae TaxID=2864201 RepID=A0A915YDP6_9BACT|nr:T9SS type A sorting domain-containing protein [Aureispira anguillae]BDS11160.1 T9SS type A sorting domain-containing protein [Aureispira anguillae]